MRNSRERGDLPGVGGESGWVSKAQTFAVAVALGVALVYGACAVALLRYPWDWSPNEGLALDYARRLVQAPSTLYSKEAVPFPAAYTPLLPILLAPIVAWFKEPLLPARAVASVWTALIAGGAYALVRRKAPPSLALICAALVLAPLDLSCWYLLVRVDGPMIAFWMWGAWTILPSRLARGADRLSWRRVWLGALLLLASVVSKPTAILYAAPLVLGWFLVDGPSARRLCAALVAAGLSIMAILEILTSGGFLWTMGLWGTHPYHPGLMTAILLRFLKQSAPLLGFAASGLAYALWCGEGKWRDGALLLVVGGLLGIPAMSKAGAWSNYLLPLLCATVALGGRLWGVDPAPSGAGTPRVPKGQVQSLAAAGAAVVALALVLTRTFPLPTAEDGATAEVLYSFVREQGRPILATWPEYAYFLLDQPTEMEGSSFPYLVAAKVPGIEKILRRLEERHYKMILAVSYLWPADKSFEDALAHNYSLVGECALESCHGSTRFVLLVPKGSGVRFDPPSGARCRVFGGAPQAR